MTTEFESNAATPKQQQRRAEILEAVRQLLTQGGYSGLTMRGVALACRVSTKLLYDVYGSKDALIAAAVAERLTAIYSAIEAGNEATGIAHLLYLGRGIADAITDNPPWARAYASCIQSDARRIFALNDAGHAVAVCIHEIAACQELRPWACPQALAAALRLQQISIVLAWSSGLITDVQLRGQFDLAAVQVLKTATSGRTQQQLLALERAHVAVR